VQLYALMIRCVQPEIQSFRAIFSLHTTQTHWTRAVHYLRKQGRLLFKLVGIPIICITLLSLVLLYIIGGTDLLRYTASQLLTWRGIQKTLTVVGGLTLLSWLRHMAWYRDEPRSMWFRRSVRSNVMGGLILIAVIALGVLAFRRYAPPPLPMR
jgi:hypothetical protein